MEQNQNPPIGGNIIPQRNDQVQGQRGADLFGQSEPGRQNNENQSRQDFQTGPIVAKSRPFGAIPPPFGATYGPSGPNSTPYAQTAGPFIQTTGVQPGQRMMRMTQNQSNQNKPNIEQQGPFENGGERDMKKKKVNRRNITNGEIILNQIDQNDKIEADTDITDNDDTLLGSLEMQPLSVRTFLENLKNGDFVEVSEKFVQQKLLTTAGIDQIKSQSENLFLQLNQIIHYYIRFIDRFIFFFQGLLAGMSLINLAYIYLNPNISQLLASYANDSIKIDQVFHIFGFISCFGSLFISIKIKQQVDLSQRGQDKRIYYQSLISCICFSAAYLFILIAHKFNADISDALPGISPTDTISMDAAITLYTADFGQFQILQIIITVTNMLGWYISVNTTESNLDYMIQFDQEFKIIFILRNRMILDETRTDE